ncbi:MAG TPA: DNA alkylation repair protein [Gemmatales bacterium]|nr:DNA alkylation repair protein [Gemmatales bacterium]
MSKLELHQLQNEINSLPNPTVPAARLLRRSWSKRLKLYDGETMLDFALKLQQIDASFHRFIAQELVHHHKPAMVALQTNWLRQFGTGMATWDAVDVFASYLSGPAWREGQTTDAEIQRWARSDDLWWRRAALVSTVPLNNKARGGQGDPKRTFMICEMLIDDREDMVVKAMSWALRELAKREPEEVQRFVTQYKSRLAARVIREVSNKLTTGKKNPK